MKEIGKTQRALTSTLILLEKNITKANLLLKQLKFEYKKSLSRRGKKSKKRYDKVFYQVIKANRELDYSKFETEHWKSQALGK